MIRRFCKCGMEVVEVYDGHYQHLAKMPAKKCPRPTIAIIRDETGRFVDPTQPFSAPVSPRFNWRGVLLALRKRLAHG